MPAEREPMPAEREPMPERPAGSAVVVVVFLALMVVSLILCCIALREIGTLVQLVPVWESPPR